METAKAKFYLSLLPEDEREDSVLNDGGVVVDGDVNTNIDGNDFFDAFDDNSQSHKDDFKDDFDL